MSDRGVPEEWSVGDAVTRDDGSSGFDVRQRHSEDCDKKETFLGKGGEKAEGTPGLDVQIALVEVMERNLGSEAGLMKGKRFGVRCKGHVIQVEKGSNVALSPVFML